MICVVVLQNCVFFVEGETGYYSETCVTGDVEGTEEVSIKVEEAIDIKEEVSMKVEEAVDNQVEIPEFVSVPWIKTEHEVRLWCVCEVVAANAFRPFGANKKEIVKLHLLFPALYYNLFAI
jgi:hypothetical protein